jgi:hypothetical protein
MVDLARRHEGRAIVTPQTGSGEWGTEASRRSARSRPPHFGIKERSSRRAGELAGGSSGRHAH